MALMNCPECGREISDKAEVCIGCGFPVQKYLEEQKQLLEEQRILEEKNKKVPCPYCGEPCNQDDDYCDECGMRLTDYAKKVTREEIEDNVEEQKEFSGIYKYTLFGGKQEVYCPRCGSENCSHYKEQKVIPGKIKTSYSANLNPLKPFTLVNKKEKVVRKEQVVTEDKFICDSCGKIFY